MARTILSFLLILTILLAEALPPPPPPTPPLLLRQPLSPTASCVDVLVSFSSCLSYVSSPPNNRSDTPTASCCSDFSSAFNSGLAVCFCYLLQQPPILGFPLNNTRLLSLSSVCPPVNGTSARIPTLDLLCAASPAMPPLNSAAAQGIASPSSNSGSPNTATPPAIIPSQSSQNSPAIPTKGAETRSSQAPSDVPIQESSGNKQIYSIKSWVLVGMLAILTHLLLLAPI